MRKFNHIIFIFLFLTSIQANSQNWIGYGKGSAFLKIENGIAKSSTCDNSFNFQCTNLNPGLNQAIFKDLDTGELKFWLWIDVMGTNKDSIKLKAQNGSTIFTFYNEQTIPLESKFDLHSFFYEIFSYENFLSKRYEITRKRTLIEYDKERNKVNKMKLTKLQIQKLDSIIAKIDVLSLNDCYGEIFISHAARYSFTFTNWDLKKYNYVSQVIPYYLDQIKLFIDEIINNHH